MAYIEFKDVIKAYGEGDARIHGYGDFRHRDGGRARCELR